MVSPRWPHGLDGLRIGHVSDFHLGDLLPIDKAINVVDCLATQQPELIACTGDVIDLDSPDVDQLLMALAEVEAPLGCLLVLGNHDELHDPDGLARAARELGIIVLRNEAVRISRNGVSMVVGGIEWGSPRWRAHGTWTWRAVTARTPTCCSPTIPRRFSAPPTWGSR